MSCYDARQHSCTISWCCSYVFHCGNGLGPHLWWFCKNVHLSGAHVGGATELGKKIPTIVRYVRISCMCYATLVKHDWAYIIGVVCAYGPPPRPENAYFGCFGSTLLRAVLVGSPRWEEKCEKYWNFFRMVRQVGRVVQSAQTCLKVRYTSRTMPQKPLKSTKTPLLHCFGGQPSFEELWKVGTSWAKKLKLFGLVIWTLNGCLSQRTYPDGVISQLSPFMHICKIDYLAPLTFYTPFLTSKIIQMLLGIKLKKVSRIFFSKN